MRTQVHNVNMQVGAGIPPIVKVSQYDELRVIGFRLFDGARAYFPGVEDVVTITGTKPSGLGFTEECSVNGSLAVVETTLAMTQESGRINAELRISDGSTNIGTANFTLYVEPAPHPAGTTDGTTEEARTVLEQCEQYAQEAQDAAETVAQDATAAVQDAVTQIIESLPSDYSELADEVMDIKADLDNLDTGITPAQQGLLISILRKAIYDGNQQELIDALEDSFGGIVHVTGITFTQASISITDVETVTASYTITPADGTDPILWESSNQNIVTVSNGVITPVGNGSATITAYTSRGISATLSVTVDLPATYSVTNNLTHATNSNSSALIVEGNSYTGVITADEGYVVTSVAVTMGGTDVTSTVYSNGTISIASVTGDIVITVGTAIAPPTPVYKGENLVFDGTANTVIDTGIKLCDTDKDFTIVLKVDTPTGDTVTGGSQLICCLAGSNGYDGYHIARATSTNLAPRAYVNSGKIDFSDAYNALNDRTQVIIMRHESGSGKIIASAYVYKNSAVSVGTLTQNFTFSAHDNTTIIGARRWNGINGHITGTLKLVEIYNRYLTDEQIAGYYE